MKILLTSWVFLFLALCPSATTRAEEHVDDSLASYEKVSGISGNLSSMGSDTLSNLMTLWAEEFQRVYPNVNIEVQAAGSSTAPPSLTEGTSSLGPMSRLMKDSEIAAFEKKRGYQPTAIAVAMDVLAIFVHQDNPIKGMSLQQADAVFSSTRICGEPSAIDNWGQLDLGGSWTNRDIQIYGRNSASGTYGFFKQYVLCKGDFRNSVNEQPGSGSVVQSVSTSLNSIGYSGIGYSTASVRTVALSSDPAGPLIEPTEENVINGSYPLSRYLYIYVNQEPGKPLNPLTVQFLAMVLSKKGQEMVIKDGYIPLPAQLADRELRKIH
jgi:phosphate transport system substrate-binding protein